MRRIDHQLVGFATLGRECCEDPVEHAKSAPPDEAVVDRFGRTIVSGRITPPQAVPDDKNDTASSTRGPPCDSGKYGSIRRICASDNQIRSLMATPPDAAIESTNHLLGKKFNRSSRNCGCFPRTSAEVHTSGCRILKEGSSHEALCRIGPVDGKHAGLHR
jgi:hypothetical protein